MTQSGEAPAPPAPADAVATTVDAFLDGRIAAIQPRRQGHRAGHDAILLAAAVPAEATGLALDLGCGSGVAGFALAARCPSLSVTLVDRDPVALALATAGLALPQNAAFAGRCRVLAADLAAPGRAREAAGLPRDMADVVVTNPPFLDAARARPSPSAPRAGAHMLGPGGLDPWLRATAASMRPGGLLALIFRADGLSDVLAALDGRFGAIAVLAVHPRANQPASRIVVRAVKGSRAPLRLVPGLVLHPAASSSPTAEADAVLRGAALRFPD